MNLNIVLIISFLIILTLGTLLHFTHDWFKKGLLLHIFSALNESTWEHMKLLIAPTFIVTIFQYFTLQESYPNIFNSILVLLVVEILSIPLLYEPLRLIVKKVPFPITISIFVISIILGILAEHIFLKNGLSIINEGISISLIIVILLKFSLFSYYPPKIFIFKDPVTGKYGDTKDIRY